jgi:hypothetical protein
MKEILCGWQQWVVQVDDEDYDYQNKFVWYVKQNKYTWYAYRRLRVWRNCYITVYMHRDLMQTPIGIEVDHKNGKGYDNQKDNMRNCTRSQNMQNQIVKPEHWKGFYFYESRKKYCVEITKDYRKYVVGYFKTRREAAIAYNKAAIELFGEFARLNVIEEGEGIV